MDRIREMNDTEFSLTREQIRVLTTVMNKTPVWDNHHLDGSKHLLIAGEQVVALDENRLMLAVIHIDVERPVSPVLVNGPKFLEIRSQFKPESITVHIKKGTVVEIDVNPRLCPLDRCCCGPVRLPVMNANRVYAGCYPRPSVIERTMKTTANGTASVKELRRVLRFISNNKAAVDARVAVRFGNTAELRWLHNGQHSSLLELDRLSDGEETITLVPQQFRNIVAPLLQVGSSKVGFGISATGLILTVPNVRVGLAGVRMRGPLEAGVNTP